MKKTMLSAAILLSLAGASMSANAAEIQFTGKISAQTCKLSAGDLKMELPTVGISEALFPKSTIKPQLPQPQVTVTLGAF
ncbi:hypothetical protein OB952_21910 [Aeromonas salmonicida]|uniref:fimbrial protein n=1 Tax=Aeromonas salmonicida TaxID=645 RepID=UPI00259E4F35|nr:hypothetical protein [Aeromonas salmonicida]MDM5069990.1 hypothetical protein [Aeromonas salmonicida]